MVKMMLDEYGVQIEVSDEGKKEFKFVSFNKFQQMILQQYNFNSGLLPVGTIAYKKNGYSESIAIIEKEQTRKVKYEIQEEKLDPRIEEFTVPVPALLWIFKLDTNKRLSNAYVFILKSLFVVPDTMLYHFPFSNVSAGSICWGQNNILEKSFRTLVGLISLTKIFFETPFNKDLDNNGTMGNNEETTLNFFKQYNGKGEFPLNILKPYKKFKEIWDEDND